MRNALIVLCLTAASLSACSTVVPSKQVSRAEERAALAAAEDAYTDAWKAYTASEKQSPEARSRAYNALTAAHSAVEATRNAFETDGAPTFMDQAVAARRLANEAKAAAES